jgi:hypothetical protein
MFARTSMKPLPAVGQSDVVFKCFSTIPDCPRLQKKMTYSDNLRRSAHPLASQDQEQRNICFQEN